MSKEGPRITRRDFDRALGAFGAAVAVGCHGYEPACPADARHDDELDGYRPKFLTDEEILTLAAAAEAMLGDCPTVISAVEVARRADQLLAATDAPAATQMRLAIHVLQSFGGLLSFDFGPYYGLSVADRREVIEKLLKGSGLERDATRVLKTLVVVPYYTHPEVRRALGFVEFDHRQRFVPLPVFTQRKVHPEPERFG